MSNRLRAPKIKNLVGLAMSQLAVAQLVYATPTLPFVMQAPYEDEDTGEISMLDVEYLFRVDPSKLTPALNNRVQACRDRINAAQQQTEKAVQASQSLSQGTTRKVSWDDLPDTDMLIRLYDEYDSAMDARLLATVGLDERGQTDWNFTGPTGEPVQLTAELLRTNLRLAERLHQAWNEWYLPTKPSSGVAMKTNKETGTTGSTPPTQEALSTE